MSVHTRSRSKYTRVLLSGPSKQLPVKSKEQSESLENKLRLASWQ